MKKKKSKTEPLKRAIIHYSFVYTESKKKKLLAVARLYGKVKDYIFNKYGGLEGLLYLNYPRRLRDEWVDSGFGDQFGLQARQWKQALEEALGTLGSLWEGTFTKIRSKASRNKKFSDFERHYINYILKSYNLVYKICKDQKIDIKFDFEDSENPINRDKCHRWLHSQLRKVRGRKPKNKSSSFFVDSSMYDLNKDKKGRTWIGIMTLNSGKRIHLLLTDDKITSKNLKIKILGNRIELHQTEEVKCAKAPIEKDIKNVTATDKGFTTLLHSDKGEEIKFGEGFGKVLSEISDKESEKNKRRNKLRHLANKLWDSGEASKIIKAKNIFKYNLGKEKYDHQKEIDRNILEDFINLALNRFFCQIKPDVLVVEKLDFQSWDKKLNRRQKRLFSRWLKGVLRDRTEFKCRMNGVHLAEVNAAYTSQTCPDCGYVHKNNRHGGRFHCLSCGKEGDADYFASLNLLSRYYDIDIDLYTPYKEVYKILMERFNARLRLSNPDSRNIKWEGASPQTTGHSESELLSKCG